ncbi:alpha/beta hydrolase family protein [Clostridium sp. LBM24168]
MIENFTVKNLYGKNIRGIINKPECSEKVPCIIYCHGLSGNRMEHNFMFVKIERSLEKFNIASVRFDFTGSGESDGDFKNMTLSSEIEDCENALEFVKKLDYIDQNNINILGFSMGAVVSLVLCSKHRKEIRNAIFVSPAINLYDIFIHEIRGEKLQKFMECGLFDVDGKVIEKTVVDDIFSYNFYECAKNVCQNTLIVHGDEDKSVPPVYSIILEDIISGKTLLKFVKGSDHCYDSPEYLNSLINYIRWFAERFII